MKLSTGNDIFKMNSFRKEKEWSNKASYCMFRPFQARLMDPDDLSPGLRSRYFASVARDRNRVAPQELPGAIGILSDPASPGSVVGIAYEAGWLGGWRWDWSKPGTEPVDLGPREATWRLVVAKVEVEGRFALRMGEFVELAEDAV